MTRTACLSRFPAIFGMFVAISCQSWSAPARADDFHPLVAKGHAFYEEALFSQALEAFDEAAATDALTRRDLVALLLGRALVHYAMGKKRSMDASLTQLASVDPDHSFGQTVPPEVVVAFNNALRHTRGRVGVRIKRETIFGGELLQAEVRNDVGALVRGVRIFARAQGGAWEHGLSMLRVHAPRNSKVAYYAVAVGPGGAPVAMLGTSKAPLHFSVGVADAIFPPHPANTSDSSVHPVVWMGIGAVAGALITVSVVLIVHALNKDESVPSVAALGSWP